MLLPHKPRWSISVLKVAYISDHLYWFMCVCSLGTWDGTYFIIMYDLLTLLLNSVCKYFVVNVSLSGFVIKTRLASQAEFACAISLPVLWERWEVLAFPPPWAIGREHVEEGADEEENPRQTKARELGKGL